MIELAGLLVFGFLAQWLAWRIRVPAILPLIIIGILVGPISTYFTPDGSKFINGDEIFQGELLFDVISISVGLILFEGGLTLKLSEVKTLGKAVRNLIIFGTVISSVGGAVAAHFIMRLDWEYAFLFGALIIVTGPTVIGPILRNVRPNFNITTVLKWEGILIDPVGALASILIYEFIVANETGEPFTLIAIKSFFLSIFSGALIGAVMAFLIYYLLRKNLIPKYLRNIVMLAMVILTFAISDLVVGESGLLAVTIMGMILANLKVENLKEILSFKQDVVLILISFLFVMLSSRIDLSDIVKVLDSRSILLFVIVVYVLRPITVFASTYKTGLNLKEKILISWICPRGIVAAGVASIFSIRLTNMLQSNGGSLDQVFQANLLLPMTFMVIVGTVVIQGLTSKPLAKWLGVVRNEPSGILFLGASEPARILARLYKKLGINVLMADTSQANINEARTMGLPVFEGSLVSDEPLEELDLSQYGQLHAMTSNTEINIMSCKILTSEFGPDRVFRLVSNREMQMADMQRPKNLLFKGGADYIAITQILRTKPEMLRKTVNTVGELSSFLEAQAERIIPLFILKTSKNRIEPVSGYPITITTNDVLYYIERIPPNFQ